MLENNEHTELSSLCLFGLIKELSRDIEMKNSSSIKGVGDDAAVINYTNTDTVTLVSTDMLVEGVHFDLTYVPLKHLGYKSAVVNFSDIYAMNGQPKQIVVSLALSSRFSLEAVEELYAGIYLACEKYGVDVVGGDTTSSMSGMVLTITVIGEGNADTIARRNT